MATDVDAFAQTATESRPEADPDPRARPDGDGPSVKPPGTEGYDHTGNCWESRSRRIRRWCRRVDTGRGAGHPRIPTDFRAAASAYPAYVQCRRSVRPAYARATNPY